MIQVSKLEAIMSELECIDQQQFDHNSISQLIDFGKRISSHMAFANSQMALAKKALNDAIRMAHINLQASLKANNFSMPASLQNDYVKRVCSDQEYAYDIAERASRTCTHVLDFMRSAISALKEEARLINFQPA